MKTRLAQRAMFILLAVMLLVGPAGRTFADEEALWERLREGGLVVLVRHALAPGTGDPSNFLVDDCSTQRNLSETGREQARLMGARFAAQG
ncbi:MAG: histidine phosphatase family protein, partial [Pseudomonadota bacterium]